MDPKDLYLLPFIACLAAAVYAIRYIGEEDRSTRGIVLIFAGLFGCLGYWMNMVHNQTIFRLMSFVFPLLLSVGLANLLFPKPPYDGAPINKFSMGGNIVFGIGMVISILVGCLLNFHGPTRDFLIELYAKCGLPA